MRKSKVIQFFTKIIIVFILFFVGCSKSTEPPPEPNIIWNLQTGNNWTFIDSLFDRDSIIVDTVFVEITKHINIDYQDEQIEVSCLVESIYTESSYPDTIISFLYVNENDGLYSYGKLFEYADTISLEISKNLKFKFPVEIGEAWLYNSDNMECIETGEDFITPYGNFICYVYKLTHLSEFTYYYCVPYIGIVGIISENDNVIKYKRLLISWMV